MKAIFLVLIVALASSCASANMAQARHTKGLVDVVLSSLGLDQILTTVQSVGSALYSQLVSLATQLMLSGQQMWQQALPVFNNLVSELTSHAGNAVQLVSQAVLQLTGVLASGPARSSRGIVDTVVELFGLNQIFSQIQNVGTALYSQFVSLATQLLFAGQQMWQQAIPVFNNLVSELHSHAGNAVQLVSQAVLQLTGVLASGPARSVAVQRLDIIGWIAEAFNLSGVWSSITSVGSALYSQFLSLATQLLFSGQQMWQQAQPVFNNLISELHSHAGNAVQLVSQAVLQLTGVLASGPARSVARFDFVQTVVGLFGLDKIWAQIQSVGSALYSQFLSLATQLLFSGQQMWTQAQPVFNNLVAELTSHAGNAVQLVSQAVLQLTGVLASGPARSARFDLIQTVVGLFGLDKIWAQLQSVGTALYSQFVSLATQLLFSGQQMWTQAQPVFHNLVAELTSHAGNAVQLVSQAVLQLTGVLASGPAY